MKDGGPNIIDAMRVIGMIMCKKHRINSIKSSCEYLFSMVRRSIDDDNGLAMGPGFLEKYRAATTPVFGIIRIARMVSVNVMPLLFPQRVGALLKTAERNYPS
jgi:hypothetical protein